MKLNRQFWQAMASKAKVKRLALGCWFMLLCLMTLMVLALSKNHAAGIVADTANLSDKQATILNQQLQALDGQDFFASDLPAIAAQLSRLTWIHEVKLERDWRQGIRVMVVPKVAVANFGSEALLSVEGAPFVPADMQALNHSHFVNLYGDKRHADDMMQQTQRINSWFAPLGIAVQDIVLTPRQTWLIRFNNGLRLAVNYEQVDERLYGLSVLLQNDALPVAFDDLAMIDLRYQNGFSLTKKYAKS